MNLKLFYYSKKITFATRTKHVNLQRISRRNYRTLWSSVLCFSQLYLKAFWQTVTGSPLEGGFERVLVPDWNLRIKGENYVWIKMIGNSPWLIPLDSKFDSGLCDMIDCTTFFTFFLRLALYFLLLTSWLNLNGRCVTPFKLQKNSFYK